MKYNISFNIRIIMAPQQTRQQRTSKSKVGLFKPKGGFDLEEEDEEPLREEKNLPPEPLFGRGGCCSGDSQKQIFWYRPMGSTDFGIHMNAEEFERVYRENPPDIKKDIFRHGVSHEYFHHIVDSWCVINEVNRDNLAKRYEKQMHAEERKTSEIYILEESMGEYLAHKWTRRYWEDCRRGTYSLWRPFYSSSVWFQGSLIVALQYLKGKYKISGLTPPNGFSKEILEHFEVPKKWTEKVSSCKLFPLDGNDAGFATHHESGVWNFDNIPFHIHHPDRELRKWYSSWRGEFYQLVLRKEPLIRISE